MNLTTVDLNLLVLFDALYRERSVTRAGARIGLSQPAASNALARLRMMFDDALFMRGPGGMEPTARAEGLAGPVSEILERVEVALSHDDRFDPATAQRQFRLGLTDYGTTLLQPALASVLSAEAPGITLGTRHTLGRAALDLLDRGELDLALSVFEKVPERFAEQWLLDERFVVIARRGHGQIGPAKMLSLKTYLDLPHLLISFAGDARGVVDEVLAKRGLERRVAMTVPHFAAAPYIVGASDLVATIAERIARRFSEVCDLVIYQPPLELPGYSKSMVWRRRDDGDAGLAWLRRRIVDLAGAL